MDFSVINDDCIQALKQFPQDHFESMVTDPPAGIAFMGKEWDKDKGGRDPWIEWMTGVMKECHRVLLPGAHAFVWALPRTSHWTATACENAGFEIRDCVTHLFGSGFPKSHNISKSLDKMAGAEREVVGLNPSSRPNSKRKNAMQPGGKPDGTPSGVQTFTAPSTPEAKQWDGFGTNLKPAAEFYFLLRKPLSEKTVAKNVLKYGVGGLNISASRIGYQSDKDAKEGRSARKTTSKGHFATQLDDDKYDRSDRSKITGRFPSNLLLSHSPHCTDTCDMTCPILMLDDQSGVLKSGERKGELLGESVNNVYGKRAKKNINSFPSDSGGASRFFKNFDHDKNGCVPECPVRMLDEDSGVLKSGGGLKKKKGELQKNPSGIYGREVAQKDSIGPQGLKVDKGGASRFFARFKYCAKSSKSERNEGCGNTLTWENADQNLADLVGELSQHLKDISGGGTFPQNDTEWSTILFGRTTMEPSQKVIRCIMSTMIKLIIELRTSPSLPLSNIKDIIRDAIATVEGNGLSLAESVECLGKWKPITTNDQAVSAHGASLAASKTLLRIKESASVGNIHSTVKPTKLMQYLITMITPPKGWVLDPFAGSGSTGVAALKAGFNFQGIEKEEEYAEIAATRLRHASRHTP